VSSSLITVKDVWRGSLPPATELLAGGQGLDRRVEWATALRTRPPAFDAIKGGEMAFVPVKSIRLLDDRLDLPQVMTSLAEKGGVAVAVVGARVVTGGHPQLDTTVAANASLVVIYVAIGWFVLRTQLANRPSMGGWSVSGLCLGAIFLTCALMHAVYAAYHIAGRYDADVHAFVIDWLSIPAGLYFLWMVRSLYRDPVRDWNSGPGAVAVDLFPVTEAA